MEDQWSENNNDEWPEEDNTENYGWDEVKDSQMDNIDQHKKGPDDTSQINSMMSKAMSYNQTQITVYTVD